MSSSKNRVMTSFLFQKKAKQKGPIWSKFRKINLILLCSLDRPIYLRKLEIFFDDVIGKIIYDVICQKKFAQKLFICHFSSKYFFYQGKKYILTVFEFLTPLRNFLVYQHNIYQKLHISDVDILQQKSVRSV